MVEKCGEIRSFSGKVRLNPKGTVEITVFDDSFAITRNYAEYIVVENDNIENRVFLALLDALCHPEKYNIEVHDLRTTGKYDTLSFSMNNMVVSQ